MFNIWYVNENGEKVTHKINGYFVAQHLKKCYKTYGYKKIKLYTDGGFRIPLF